MRNLITILFLFFSLSIFSQDGKLVSYKKSENLYGYKMYGKIRIKAVFQEAKKFHHGYAVVKKDDLYGMIDSTGMWYINPTFSKLSPFIRGQYIALHNNDFKIYDMKGAVLFQSKYLKIDLVKYKKFLESTHLKNKASLIQTIEVSNLLHCGNGKNKKAELTISKSVLNYYITTKWVIRKILDL